MENRKIPRAICAIVVLSAFIAGSFDSEAAEAAAKNDKPKKSFWSLNKMFKKELGVVSVAEPPKEKVPQLLTIDDCIKIAMANYIPLGVAKKNIKLAEMRLFEARRNMLPSATIAYEQSSGRVNSRRYAGKKQYIEGQQPVFHGGELVYSAKQAEANLRITKMEYEKAVNELKLQVKKAYYALHKAKENYRLQTELTKEVVGVFEMVSKEYESGVTSKLEMLNVTSQESQVKYQLASSEGDMATAELILKQAMNIDTGEPVEIQPLEEFQKVDVSYNEAIRVAYVKRPEILINQYMVEYYNYGRNVARAKGWPKIDLLGSWGLAREEYVLADNAYDLVDPNLGTQDPNRQMSQQWYFGIKGSVPLWGNSLEYSHTAEQWVPVVSAFQGTEAITDSVKLKVLDKLDYYSDKQLADIDLDRARQEFVKSKNDVTLEVKEGCFNYEKALIQLDTSKKKIKYQETDLEVTKFKRGMDEAADSNVVDSMIKLSQEKFGYVQAVTDCYTSLASINKAIGVEDYFSKEKNNIARP